MGWENFSFQVTLLDNIYFFLTKFTTNVLWHISGGDYYDDLNELIIKLVTAEGPTFQCAKCRKVMRRKDHIKNHVRTHFEGQEVTCYLCGKVYKNLRSLEVHRSSYHQQNPWTDIL